MSSSSFKDIRAAFEKVTPIPDSEWKVVESVFRLKTVRQGEFLIREGDPVTSMYFVRSGIFRVFYLSDDAEINRSFVLPGRFYTNSLSMHTGSGSNYWVEALTDAELPFVSRSDILHGYERHPCWERFGRLSAERRLNLKELQEQRFRSMSPEEHYFWMVENEPLILKHIPLYHLASYLRIRPETLSRIRSKSARR